jgi:hypothetical protein
MACFVVYAEDWAQFTWVRTQFGALSGLLTARDLVASLCQAPQRTEQGLLLSSV